MQNDQNIKLREKQKEASAYEVAQAVKVLKNSELRLASTARYRGLMEKQLEAETERYNLGLVGSEWLFEYQRRLGTAKTQELKAAVDYKIALAGLERAEGTTLKAKNIKFRDYAF